MLKGQKCIFGFMHTSQILKLFFNQFHSQQAMFKGFNSVQRTVLSQKFLARNESYFKKRKKESAQIKPLGSASSIFGSENVAITSRRLERLNKIFMEKISETLLTSQYASPLMKIGFEITQIKVQPKLSYIHIYWYYSQTTDEEELNKILFDLSHHLRTELNSQHILGRIPPIVFIKDSHRFYCIEIDKRLEIADFGPDETIEDAEDNPENSNSLKDSNLDFPNDVIKIRQNVFGVNREKIMLNVMKNCKESKGLHRLTDDPIPPSHNFHQAEALTPYLPNVPAHSRTREIKKWASQFKKERKALSKKQKYAEHVMLMPVTKEEQEECFDTDFEEEEDFLDEDSYEYKENYNPDDR